MLGKAREQKSNPWVTCLTHGCNSPSFYFSLSFSPAEKRWERKKDRKVKTPTLMDAKKKLFGKLSLR